MLDSLILVFGIGFLAGAIGGMAGGGGLLSIPLLISMGLPPQIAIATNKFGALGVNIGALIKFLREKRIVWGYILSLSILSIIGAFIGANMLLSIPQDILSPLVGVIILLLLPFLLINRRMGIKRTESTKEKKAVGYLLYFLIAVFGGFFGGYAGAHIAVKKGEEWMKALFLVLAAVLAVKLIFF